MNGVKNAARRERRADQGGFTLIELIIVMTVIGVLTMVAYPSYLSYKVRSNRAAAQAVLMNIAFRQQQYFADARAYSSDLSVLGYATPSVDISAVYSIDSPTVDNSATPPSFALTATPRSGTMQANDGQLRMASTGVRTRGTLPW